jgi:hypothetical protein
MCAYSPLVIVQDGLTFIETSGVAEATLAAVISATQWQYIHGRATSEELLPYVGVVLAGRTVQTDPDLPDELGRLGLSHPANRWRG